MASGSDIGILGTGMIGREQEEGYHGLQIIKNHMQTRLCLSLFGETYVDFTRNWKSI